MNYKLSILTDARLGWLNISTQTSVVCISNKTSKELQIEVVTVDDDPVLPQHHDDLRTENIYPKLDIVGEKIVIHCSENDCNG